MAAFSYSYTINESKPKLLEFDGPASSIMTILQIIKNDEFGDRASIVSSWGDISKPMGGVIEFYGVPHRVMIFNHKK